MSRNPWQEIEDLLVKIPVDSVTLEGNLSIPEGAGGIVLFAHGSGSSRHSPRNRSVAQTLYQGKLATLLTDLLTAEEEAIDQLTRGPRFDIDLLARRLVGIADWIGDNPGTAALKIGLFGSSTGAAAALIAAKERPESIYAVVSRGGRPDLADAALAEVKAPTLLIVGGNDFPVIGLNEHAFAKLEAEKEFEIVLHATHLFVEPATLEKVATLARDWFLKHLTSVYAVEHAS